MSATNPGASAQGFGAPQAVARVVSLLPSTFHFIPRHRPLCRGTRGGSWPLAVCPTHAIASSSRTIGTCLRAASRRDCDGLSRDRDHHPLYLGGTYGDPNAGDPVQDDELRIEHPLPAQRAQRISRRSSDRPDHDHHGQNWSCSQNANVPVLPRIQAAIASPGSGHGSVIGERWPAFLKGYAGIPESLNHNTPSQRKATPTAIDANAYWIQRE